ncbi:rho guanine nucleotide exchange factor 18-like isoform X3 [Neocloeon triangulifer]|uniref:rho guanine nucleotide exchange factor 18-like isoform X3 n=1 Tax=Neocloeon triangulifer TaxID=2078957 RepID=UPI00286F4F9D|nr:rho guanine nucleotide exchange factor 18-like isoform X3 [Neocloeon triangulifer]
MAGRRKSSALNEAHANSVQNNPFSNDEYHNSADDSDEDVITDYLAITGASTSCDGAMAHQTSGPLVPIISVTPHSPASMQYPVLDDNIYQLHAIHECIQQMRETSAQAFNQQMLQLNQYSRLSVSCPTLNDGTAEADFTTSVSSSPTQQESGSQFGSAHNTPQGLPSSTFRVNLEEIFTKRNGEEPKRRRSWTSLSDVNFNKKKMETERQRSSISLSSMDSDQDDPFSDQPEVEATNSTMYLVNNNNGTKLIRPTANAKNRRASGTLSPVNCNLWNLGGASTHSLNEEDLLNDFNKIVASREAERLLPARLPLQKSVSTPSIIAVRDVANENAAAATADEKTEPLHASILNPTDKHDSGGVQRPSGTESETEEDVPGDIIMDIGSNKLFPYPLKPSTFELHEGKQRKRGSIFFRKKKDKSKKTVHQWVAVSYGSPHGCDWCSKVLTNKPALYCESCAVTVHQNSCMDQIGECTKTKTTKSNLAKVAGGLGSHLPGTKMQGKRSVGSTPPQNTNSQIINEEKEADHFHRHHHGHHDNFSDEAQLLHFEFLDESPITAQDLETDPFLGLHEDEPDSWTPTVGKEVTRKLKDKEIKRQEHIYEFILTEKTHCLTLRVMQKVFVEGLQKYFQLGNLVDRMFPRLQDLTEIHLSFLYKLRERQKSSTPVIESIADIVLEQFSGEEAAKLKSAYGEFCSRHRDAVDLYKDCLHQDQRFGEFVKHCQTNPLLKKKGIPECVLFVTQRLTKYPLLIEPLIKTAKDNKPEQEKLSRALALVKEILVEVDAQVAEKEKEDRKLEIYNRIDAKSFTTYRGSQKFKKSDILSANRKLKFEGYATLMQGRNKMQLVLVIVLSDVLFFLLDNNNKYTFFTPDNKAGVVSLQKLLVREKAGQESRGIYLISSNPNDPEMFELKVIKPKEKLAWINAIRLAVQQCPEEDEEKPALSNEEKQKLLHTKQMQIQQIVGVLRQKDLEQALILEEKMALQLKLLAASGLENLPEPPTYSHIVAEDADTNALWKEVLTAFHEVNQLASTLYASGTNLSRSVSSVGEHQSEAYISPTLPKRAETFGGFDNANKEQLQAFLNKAFGKKQNQKDQYDGSSASIPEGKVAPQGQKTPTERMLWKNFHLSPVTPGLTNANQLPSDGVCEMPQLMPLSQEQQMAAVRLSHYLYTLLSIISHQMTTIDSMQASLSAFKHTQEDKKPVYRHNQQLEELRNLQDKLTQEREAWSRVKEAEERDLEERRSELTKLQDRLNSEQTDIIQQRETLHRRLEMLTSQGILISPNMPMVIAANSEEPESPGNASNLSNASTAAASTPSPPAESRRKFDIKWKSQSQAPSNGSKSNLPLNLISATNMQKSGQGMQVKQQLPLKLAKLGGSSSSSSTSLPAHGRDGVQQMLPMKLSQADAKQPTTSPGGYHRLSSNSFGPASASPKEAASHSSNAPTHVRTGSSPAMMQAHQPGVPSVAGSTLPWSNADKNPTLPANSKTTQKSNEEEVIYF